MQIETADKFTEGFTDNMGDGDENNRGRCLPKAAFEAVSGKRGKDEKRNTNTIQIQSMTYGFIYAVQCGVMVCNVIYNSPDITKPGRFKMCSRKNGRQLFRGLRDLLGGKKNNVRWL